VNDRVGAEARDAFDDGRAGQAAGSQELEQRDVQRAVAGTI